MLKTGGLMWFWIDMVAVYWINHLNGGLVYQIKT